KIPAFTIARKRKSLPCVWKPERLPDVPCKDGTARCQVGAGEIGRLINGGRFRQSDRRRGLEDLEHSMTQKKSVIVTGSTSGLGFGMAEGFAKAGMSVMLN